MHYDKMNAAGSPAFPKKRRQTAEYILRSVFVSLYYSSVFCGWYVGTMRCTKSRMS